MLWVVDYDHSYYSIVAFIEAHTANTGRGTAHGADLVLIEANGTAISVGENQLVVTIGQANIYYLISFYDIDGNHTIGTWTGVSLQASLLHGTILGSEDYIVAVDELCVIQSLQSEECIHLVIALYVEEVLDGTTLRVAVALWNLVALQPVAAALLGEEQHGLVHGGWIDILGEVLVASAGTLGTNAAASLLTEFRQWSTLDVTQVTHGDNHWIVWIEILWVELVVVWLNHGAARVTILLLHLVELILHYLLAKLRVVQYLVQVVDGLHQLVEFIVQLLQAKTCELAQSHIHNGLTLQFIQVETLLQVALSVGWSLAGTDDVNHLVDIVAGDNQTLENMSTLLRLLQFKLGATDSNIVTMVYKVLYAFLQGQEAWTTANQGDAIHRE